MLRLLSTTVCAIALAAGPAFAQTIFVADLRGASENPPANSPGRGFALVVFDPSFTRMTVRTTFSGLTTPTVDAHIHCCAPTTANAVVAVGFRPAGFPIGVTQGEFTASFDLNILGTFNPPFVTANGGTVASARTALINGTQGGLAYVNIHTSRFPGGEIRGQLFTGADLTPQAYSLLPDVALQTAEFQDSTIRRYLREVRDPAHGSNGQTATLGDNGEIGLFLMAGIRSGEFEDRTNRPQLDLDSTGFIGGVDYRFGPGTRVGLMAGIDSSDVQLTPSSRESDVKTWFGGVYGSFGFGRVFIDLHASYAESDYDLFRQITVGTFSAESLAETESEQLMLAGTAGLSLGTSDVEIEPYVGARYVNLDLDPVAETGNIAALTLDSSDIDSLQSIVGLQVSAGIPVGGATVRPSIRGEWRHEFEDDRLIAASFGGIAPFTFAATPLGDDHFVIGSGFTVSGGGPLSVVVDYNGQLGGGYDIHALSGGVRVTF